MNKIISNNGFTIKEVIKYKENEIIDIDFNYIENIEKRCYSLFELIPDAEFEEGIKLFKENLMDKKMKIKYSGKTGIVIKKEC